MEQVAATRSELLVRRDLISLAAQGKDLLQQKREQLMEEYRKTAEIVLGGAGALDRATAGARRSLALAEALEGPESIRSAAMLAPSDVPIDARTTTVMGVRIADIAYEPVGRSRFDRGYSLAASGPLLDAAAGAFEGCVDQLLELAAVELRLRKLIEEIATTTRRSNALEHVVIPRLQTELRQIQSALDERERQDRFRLKRIKARRGSRIETGDR